MFSTNYVMADLRGQIPVQITNMLMTHHIIEEVITKVYQGETGLFYDMVRVVKNPFQVQDNAERFALAPLDDERVHKTFCGT